jgi:hypothetical protein
VGSAVAERAKLILGYLAQVRRMDFAGARFWQAWGDWMRSGVAIGPISLRTQTTSSLCSSADGGSSDTSVT